jgi:hypothetical protein
MRDRRSARYILIAMAKMRKTDKAARTVSAKVSKSRRGDVVKNATSRVSAKAAINFRSAVRK